MTASLLLTHGYIHSVAEPYATAMHIDNGVIAWLGSNEAAEQMVAATASGPVETQPLDGFLVTPAFIDGLSTTPQSNRDERIMMSSTTSSEAKVYYAPMAQTVDHADGIFVAAEQLHRLPELLQTIKPPTQLLIATNDSTQLHTVLEALGTQPHTALMRSRHRIVANYAFSHEQIEALSRLNVSITLVPDISDGQPVFHAPVADLLAAGVQVATGTGSWNGPVWELLTGLIEHPVHEQRVSTRAAFNTVARDGIRVLPSRIAQEHLAAGQLAVGSPANLNIWQAEQLGVQAPDVKAAHWSTDKRAGTALLPILSSSQSAPELKYVIRNGQLA